MESDRELLEWAAKAAGIELSIGPDGIMWKNPGDKYLIGFWKPLTDDGDALRLAVKLGMEVSATHADHMATAYVPGAVQGHAHDYAACNGDANAAMRRAIVRAAASIGKAEGEVGNG